MNHRLALFVATLLSPAACGGSGGSTPTGETGGTGDTGNSVVFDDQACLIVDLGAACPSEEAARAQLVGQETCEDPVRRIVATGALVSETDVVGTGYYGYYSPASTADTGGPEGVECCYEAAYTVPNPNAGCTIGRPLTFEGKPVRTQAVARSDWSATALVPDLTGLDADEREALADAWLHDALMEHASVPAFARVAQELAALGAPPELVLAAAQAMADEVRHAKACFALASAYAGRSLGPGPIDAPVRAVPTLSQLAVETFLEGCVGESLAVGRAAVQLRHATDPAVRRVLQEVVDDEGRHAELAWRIVRWAVRAGGDEVREALATELAALSLRASDPSAVTANTRSHGIVDTAELDRALDDLLTEVVRPLAEEILAA
jgi:hypothetical protein